MNSRRFASSSIAFFVIGLVRLRLSANLLVLVGLWWQLCGLGIAQDGISASPELHQVELVPLDPDGWRQSGGLRVQRNVSIAMVADADLKVDIFRLPDESLRPAVLMIHGGAWATGDKKDLEMHARRIAKAGMVAICTNYRLAPKFLFPAQLDDCKLAFRWVKSQHAVLGVVRSRIALWGYSAGGQLAGLLAISQSATEFPIVACVMGGAPSDFSFVPPESDVLAYAMGGSQVSVPEVYRLASPLELATRRLCPTFLFHGTADGLIPTDVSRRFFQRLQELGVTSELYIVEGKGHLLTFLDAKARDKSIDFLRTHFEKASPKK